MLPTSGTPDAKRVTPAFRRTSEEPYTEPVSLALLGVRLLGPFAARRGRARVGHLATCRANTMKRNAG